MLFEPLEGRHLLENIQGEMSVFFFLLEEEHICKRRWCFSAVIERYFEGRERTLER